MNDRVPPNFTNKYVLDKQLYEDTGTVYDACLKVDETTPILPINLAFASYRTKLSAEALERGGFNALIHRLD
ncbi:MAG: hypothetical protein LBU65_07635 [Planctomycetaceae bacterium]|nr:hypothetical protein [Planctomycetaceae bacterium]